MAALKTAPLYVAEIVVWDPSIVGTRTLRYASGQGFTTKPSETPASTPYDMRIDQGLDISRTMFSGASTQGRSTVSLGDLVLRNNGGLDALVAYGFDGQAITVRRTTVLNPAYPADFTTVFVGTMLSAEFTSTEVRIKLRDRQQLVTDAPFQTTKYAGDNALPVGLEGVATDLKGKPKPVLYGVAKNLPVPCVNTSKLIYQVSDGAINSVDAVYDRGVVLAGGFGSFTTAFSSSSNTTNGIVYGASLWVAVKSGGAITTSPDAVTWTARTSGFGATDIFGVCYDATLKFCAVGDSGKISTSADGITWTARTSGVATTLYGVTVHLGLFVACGDSGVILTSPDGVTWTAQSSGVAVSLFSIASSGSWLVAMQGGTKHHLVSQDASTWTQYTNALTGAVWRVIWTGTRFVCGTFNGLIGYSADETGSSFFVVASSITNVTGLAAAQGLVLATGFGGSVKAAFSRDDGKTWTNTAQTFPDLPQGAAFGNGTFLIGAFGNEMYRSTSVDAYASQSDLLDDAQAPAAGAFKVYAAGGYFRLGSTPDGIITADATQGANAAARTAAQMFKLALARAGYTSSTTDYNATDISDLDTANPAVLGYWSGLDETTVGDVIDLIAQTVGAWWANDAAGVFRIKQLTAPSGTAAISFTNNDFKRPLERITPNDPNGGIPVYKVTMRWGKYYQTITTDLALGVDDAARAAFAQEWRDVTDSDSATLTAHPLSTPLVIETLFSAASDASTEATRVLTLRKTQRGMYEAVVELNSETIALEFGSIVSIAQSRYGMSAGVLFRVLDLRPNANSKELTLTLWGNT